MAWKMRKDKAQTAPAEEDSNEVGTSLADTAVPAEQEISAQAPEEPAFQEPEYDEPVFQNSGSSPFVMAPAQDELLPLQSESTSKENVTEHAMDAPPVFADTPPVFEEEPFPAPVFDFTPTAEPAFAKPAFDEATTQRGPFTPFQPITTEEGSSESPLPEELDRDTVAPSLVHAASDRDVPSVAPFIVDLPPVADDVPAAAGTLSVRIGNFSASFQVTNDTTLIGRPDSALQSYPDVEIELDDAVSRRHAELRRREKQYFLVDLNSTNGTLLNGHAMEPGREYSLTSGDRIHLGDRTEIIFE